MRRRAMLTGPLVQELFFMQVFYEAHYRDWRTRRLLGSPEAFSHACPYLPTSGGHYGAPTTTSSC